MPISTPSQITVPFATSGLKNAIPAASNPVTGNAGYDAGFPATNMTPKEAGGIPPFGQDFNGILFDITTAIRYLEAGMQFPYSSSFATAVGGYPLGAIVTRTDGSGFWRNGVANNTTDPETFGAGWAPEGAGITTVVMSGANITLTALQAARQIIIITGTLTANLQLLFPSWQRQWLIINNATGPFFVTCRPTSGGGISISTGLSQSVYGDGTSFYAASATQTQQSVAGTFSNLRVSSTGLNAIVSISADEIALEASAGNYLTVRSVSITSLSLAGSGANGLDTGTSSATTGYYVWVISNGTTTSGLLSLSQTSPTMPSGYTYKALVSWVKSDSTANKYPLRFFQAGKFVELSKSPGTNLATLPVIASGSTSGAFVSVTLTGSVPPNASKVKVSIYTPGDANAQGFVAPTTAYSVSDYAGGSGPAVSNYFLTSIPVDILLQSSSSIAWASAGPNSKLTLLGFELNL